MYSTQKSPVPLNPQRKTQPPLPIGPANDAGSRMRTEKALCKCKFHIGKATKLTKFILKKQGIESPTSDRNFRRYTDNFKKYHYDQWILSREGQKALTIAYMV